MRKKILELLLGITLFVWAKQIADANLQAELFGMAIGIAGIFLIELVDYMIMERRFLKIYWDCYKPFQRPELRLTFSYLFRIEMNGRYLLIKSNRIENTYQPVGGVYKYFNPEATGELIRIGAIPDNNIPNDGISEYDLRMNLTNRKKIGSFLKWFFSIKNRECDPWREFYEELVSSNILSADKFGYIHYELVGQHLEPIHYDKFFKVDTLKYADIYIPKFLNNSQIEEVKKLFSSSSSEFIWVTKDEIIKGISNDSKRIAEHTHKIFDTNKLHQ